MHLLDPEASEADCCPVLRGEDIDEATLWLEHFVSDFAEGVTEYHPDILILLLWSTAVLWMTSGEQECASRAPRLYRVLASDRGVSFKLVAELIPPFLRLVLKGIDSRTEAELRIRTIRKRDFIPLTDDEVPF